MMQQFDGWKAFERCYFIYKLIDCDIYLSMLSEWRLRRARTQRRKLKQRASDAPVGHSVLPIQVCHSGLYRMDLDDIDIFRYR